MRKGARERTNSQFSRMISGFSQWEKKSILYKKLTLIGTFGNIAKYAIVTQRDHRITCIRATEEFQILGESQGEEMCSHREK